MAVVLHPKKKYWHLSVVSPNVLRGWGGGDRNSSILQQAVQANDKREGSEEKRREDTIIYLQELVWEWNSFHFRMWK